MVTSHRHQILLIVLILCALLGYCLPWLANPGISLSLNAYDLAEWTSLHPLVRDASIPFMTTLLLRLPLVCLGLLIALGTFHTRPVMRLTLMLIIAIALLPPLEYFTQATSDPNYRQQFVLALITGLIGIILLSSELLHIKRAIFIVSGLIGCLASFIGLIQADGLMQGFGLATQIGFGGFVSIFAFGGILLTTPFIFKSKQGGAFPPHTTLQDQRTGADMRV